MIDAFQAVQTQADADAVFVRGETAWRKHVSVLNDRVDEAVHRELQSLTTQIARHADAVSETLTESLARAQLSAKRALAKQGDMYQDKLRRTRSALKKEMDRFATLETCLRAEQARQREALHEQHVKEITEAHRDREAHLHATLRDLRSAYTNVETANEQLLEALRASRREAEQLKNTLIASRSSSGGANAGNRHTGTSRRGSSSVFGSTSPGRGSTDSAGSPMLKGMALTASELVEQNLRQALATANKELASAKQQVVELEREQRASDKREQQAQDQAAKVQGELARAMSLLAEAKAELVAGQERVAELERERDKWREEQRELQFRLDASVRRVDDLMRVDEAKRAYVAELERQQQHLERRDARFQALEDALTKWQTHCDAGDSRADMLERMVTAFLADCALHDGVGDAATPSGLYDGGRATLEAKLRFEMEKRFGDQLGLRVAHERKRVLARLEMLCGHEQQSEGIFVDLSGLLTSPSRLDSAGKDRKKRLQTKKSAERGGNPTGDSGRAMYLLLSRVVQQAYEDLGVCVGDWSETDLDALVAKVHALEGEIAVRSTQLTDANTQLELQRLSLARSELLQNEKEALIAELTDRCRQLRAAFEGVSAQSRDKDAAASSTLPPYRQPLTVYGVTQPIETKRTRRAASLMGTSTQARPMSAAPALAALASAPTSKVPMPSRLGALASGSSTDKAKMNGRWTDASREEDDERESRDAPEHVRSVLKSQLMQPEPNNQQDGGTGTGDPRNRATPPPLGSEGVRQVCALYCGHLYRCVESR